VGCGVGFRNLHKLKLTVPIVCHTYTLKLQIEYRYECIDKANLPFIEGASRSNATFCSACFDSRFEEGADFFPDLRGNPVKRSQYKRIARNTLFETVYNTIQSEKGERGYSKNNCNYRFPTLDSGECDPWQNNIATIPRDALKADDIAFVIAHVLAQEDCICNHLDLAGVCYNNDGFGHIGFKAIANGAGGECISGNTLICTRR
jgi:hypothetical protein